MSTNNSDMDQAMQPLIDSFPLMWWGLYTRSLEQGFNEQQALELVKCYIISLGGVKL